VETAKHRKEDDIMLAAYAEGMLATVLTQQQQREEGVRVKGDGGENGR